MARKNTSVFGARKSSTNNAQENNEMTNAQNTPVTVATASSTVISQEKNVNTANRIAVSSNIAATAFANVREYSRSIQTASIEMSVEEVLAASVQDTFEGLLGSGRVNFTRALHGSRKAGVPVIFFSDIQMQQLGRALAYIQSEIYVLRLAEHNRDLRVYNLIDVRGDNDRAVVARVNSQSGEVFYKAHYATKHYNDFGGLKGIEVGEEHPVHIRISDQVRNHNARINSRKEAAVAVAKGIATDSQKAAVRGASPAEMGLNENEFVQREAGNYYNIKEESIVNKYQMVQWLLGNGATAFEIYTSAKTEEALGRYAAMTINAMDKAYRSELMKLAGHSRREEANAE